MRTPVPIVPSKRPTYNAGSAVEIPYVSRSRELAEATPSATRWRLDDLTNSRVISNWAAITPAVARGVLTIPSSSNAMFGDAEPTELRQVTFEFTVSGQVRQELYHYELARVYQGATS